MITRRDLDEEIRRLEDGPPTMQSCERLAVLYFVRQHLGTSGEDQPARSVRADDRAVQPSASYSPAEPADLIGHYGDSDFLEAIEGQRAGEVIAVMDELMSVLLAINPQLYASVMRKLGKE